jgi:hypothetical protein
MRIVQKLEDAHAPQLDVLRAGLGIALIASFAPLAGDVASLYGNDGWMSRDAFAVISLDAGWPSAFALVSGQLALSLASAAFIAAAALFTVGWAVRWVKWPLWALYVSLLNRNPALVYGADLLMANLLFIVCVAPAGRSFVLGRKSGTGPAGPRAAVCLALVRWQMAIMFFFTAIQKLRGSLWWSGDAVWVAVNNVEFANLPIAGLIAGNPWLGVIAAHCVLIIELAYPFLVWGSRTRAWMIGAAIALHLMTAIVFGLYLFAWIAIAGHLAFAPRIPRGIKVPSFFPSLARLLAKVPAATMAQPLKSKEVIMNWSRTTAMFLVTTLSAVSAHAQSSVTTVPRTQANAIVCPVDELRYGIGIPLPDPWMTTVQVATEGVNGAPIGPYTIIVAGKEWLACRWEPNRKMTPFAIRRPLSPQPPETWPCPAQVDVKVLTPLPDPWRGTHHPATLVSKTVGDVGGLPENQCKYEGLAPAEIVYELPVTTQPTVGGLARTPRTVPVMDDLKQTFFVTKALLTAIPSKVRTSCPTTVRFEGRITANGPGQVRWRREINGQRGPLQTLNFTSLGEKVVLFNKQVDVGQQQSGGLGLTAQAQSPNVVNGLARIVIESPEGVSESNMTSYEITCTPMASTGSLAQPDASPPPRPLPMATTAPGASPRIGVGGGRIPVKTGDGRTGWVLFEVSGEPGGRASGRITLALGAAGAQPVRTEYEITRGILQANETNYEFILQGTAKRGGAVPGRHFSSRLKLASGRGTGRTAGGVSHVDSWERSTFATGDVWVIDGLTCQRSGRDIVCL